MKFKALQSAKVSAKASNEALAETLGIKLLNLLKEQPTLTQKEVVATLNGVVHRGGQGIQRP